ncbi:MAG TPA: RagB/SusD family nutrient uptake outer membrane protein [Balneolaceae bacterium]
MNTRTNIMEKLKLLSIVLIVIPIFGGCDSLLSTEPKQSISSEIALTNSDNVELVLVGAYDALSDEDAYGGYTMLLPDLLANSGDLAWDGTYTGMRNIWLKEQTVSNGFVEDTWLAFYNMINITNNVLSALDVVDADIRGRVEGEAKFLRGVAYFELVRLYAKPWNQGDPAQNLGVPLVLLPDSKVEETQDLPRATVAEVYAQVIKDLEDAKSLLPPSNGVFATEFAAAGMLARVYLQQQRYQQAAEEANYVIENGGFSLEPDYADAFNRVGGVSTEDIFTLRISAQDGFNTIHNHYASDSLGGRGDITLTSQHLSLYEETDGERRDINYTDEEGVRTGKYTMQYGNVPVIRLAEMYLTRAESNFRLGIGSYVGPNTPAEDLNIVRNRVDLPAIANPTLQDILDERFLELAFEGHWLHDMKRLELSPGGISWDDANLVFPIPLREMNVNKNLVQNEGYGG